MNWGEPVIDYCERLDHAFWAEPLNALTNAAFLIAAAFALMLWRRQGRSDWPALALIAVTIATGIGSFIFHTVATRVAVLFDVIPIACFIYGYFGLSLMRFLGLGRIAAIAGTLAFALASVPLARIAGAFVGGSAGYVPALLALCGMSLAVWWRASRQTNAGARSRLVFVAAMLAATELVFLASLTLRTLDRDVCGAFPAGTHFIWHLLNALVLYLLLRTAIRGRPAPAR